MIYHNVGETKEKFSHSLFKVVLVVDFLINLKESIRMDNQQSHNEKVGNDYMHRGPIP